MNTAVAAENVPVLEPRHHRRSREEVEALAKNFVAPDAAAAAAAARPRARIALAGGGMAVMAALVVLFWPGGGEQAARPQVDTRAAAEAEQWRTRYEAERERKRRQLLASSEYMKRMAAADATLLKEMSERAGRLTAGPEAPPAPAIVSARQVPANVEPTPKDDPAPRKATAQVASAAPAVEAARPQPKSAPPPAKEPATKSEPAPATVAAAPQCKLHVTQLSASGTLTYADVANMKGARDIGDGKVLTPPVTVDNGRRVVFEVSPDGCMKWRRA